MNINLSLLIPEIYFAGLVLALFFQSLVGRNKRTTQYWILPATAVGFALTLTSLGARGTLFSQAYRVDALSQFFKAVIAFGFMIAATNAVRQPTLEDSKRADYFMFFSLSALGLTLLASAVELVTMYLALELSAYSLYAVIPLRSKDPRAAEAAVKYILFGAVATALSLYGLSYIMAVQHSTFLKDLGAVSWAFGDVPMAVIGLSLYLVGMFYKLALFPFHFWAPDVYQGASNETAAYVATLPKMGAVVILVRLAAMLKPGLEITTILAVLGAASMTYGNFAALAQKDLKRLLGFSSVAHAGYVMVGLVAGSALALSAAAFYAMAYLLMNLLCFWVISRIAVDGRNLTFSDLNGLYKRAPVLAFSLAAGAFALVGLPPTVGFIGKFFLIAAAWNQGYNWLVIILVVNSAIAIYYYLSLVRHAYTEDTPPENSPAPDVSAFSLVGAGLLAAIVLLIGIIPAPFFEWAFKAGNSLIP